MKASLFALFLFVTVPLATSDTVAICETNAGQWFAPVRMNKATITSKASVHCQLTITGGLLLHASGPCQDYVNTITAVFQRAKATDSQLHTVTQFCNTILMHAVPEDNCDLLDTLLFDNTMTSCDPVTTGWP